MENANKCDVWELLYSDSSFTSDHESIVDLGTVDDVMSHYFGVNLEEEEEEKSEEGGIDSDNPSWIDTDSDAVEQREEETAIFVSEDETKMIEPSNAGNKFEGADESQGSTASFPEDSNSEGIDGNHEEKKRVEDERVPSEEETTGGVVASWEYSFRLLKLWVANAKSVWAISMAAANVVVVVLRSCFYRMRQRVSLALAVDDKASEKGEWKVIKVFDLHVLSPV
ncbi:uncharacterized protein LOC103968408 isoform X1 [Musa acuminata AAA Group]|uniref:uncharacterized protein LOC103968408 isoform X1 n=1 Tax=Musa acuminata AAA Group TaxID=214697 RepID=UPI0031D5D5E0